MAIHLFHQQLQLLIAEGKTEDHDLTSVLSTLIHLNPFQAMGSGELGFLWITEILNSGYQEGRCGLADRVVELLGRYFFHKDPAYFVNMEPAWIPPLLGFLSLGEEMNTTTSTRIIALRILIISQESANFGPMILPILTSTLLPTHPLHARRLALNVFLRFVSGWFSSQMKDVLSKDLRRLVRAVGDPFQFPDLPLQDEKLVDLPNYDPMVAATVLIEFTSLDLWRNHLRRSNFTSFEDIVSTWDGKRTALQCMLGIMRNDRLPDFLCTAAKIAMAIRRLEELQCSNTVEVVIMWAWTVGVVNPVDHDGWQLIERDTLRFYQTHGMERLIALRRHVADAAMDPYHLWFLVGRYGGFRFGVGNFVKLPVLKLLPETVSKDFTYLQLSRTCQVRRLYRLFGCDPVTWKEGVEGVDIEKGMSVSSGRSVTSALLVDWACDYP